MRKIIAGVAMVGLVSLCLRAFSESSDISEICEYDTFCDRVKDRHGNVIKPKPAILKLVEEMRDPIKDAGKEFGVDPRAIAGSVLAEHTMNVQVDDDAKLAMASLGISHIGQKYFSIGFGQIHVDAALEVEPMVAKLEHRAERSEAEITKALLNPVEAIKYAAGILKEAQDEYKQNGYDISGRIDLLTTLYNLGKIRSRAATIKETGAKPRTNYFGLFVKSNLNQIGDTIGWDPVKGSTKPPVPTTENSGSTFLTKSLNVTRAPPDCSTIGNGESGEYYAVVTRSNYGSPQPLKSNSGLYRVVGRAADCDMHDWYLIETGSGKLGWAPKDKVELATGRQPASEEFKCTDSPAVSACKQKILSADSAKEFLGTDKEYGISYLPISTQAPNPSLPEVKGPVDWHNFNASCLSKDMSYYGGTGASVRLTPAEANAYASKIRDFKANIASSLGLKSWNSPDNPFADSAYSGDDPFPLDKNLEGCGRRCAVYKKSLDKLLKISPDRAKTLKGFEEIQSQMRLITYSSEKASTGQQNLFNYIKDSTTGPHASLLKARATCADILKNMPDQKKKLDDLDRQLADVDAQKKAANDKSESKNIVSVMQSLSRVCEDLSAIAKVQAGDQTLSSRMCSLSAFRNSIRGTAGSLSKVTISDADKLEMVDNALRGLHGSSSARNSFYDNMDCRYDPKATAERVKKIADLPCVEAVLVTDPYLLKATQDQHADRIISLPISEGDRFGVKFKSNCSGRMVSPWESKK